MAKAFFLPLLLALCGLTLPFPFFAPTPFTVFVVDDQTGLGVHRRAYR